MRVGRRGPTCFRARTVLSAKRVAHALGERARHSSPLLVERQMPDGTRCHVSVPASPTPYDLWPIKLRVARVCVMLWACSACVSWTALAGWRSWARGRPPGPDAHVGSRLSDAEPVRSLGRHRRIGCPTLLGGGHRTAPVEVPQQHRGARPPSDQARRATDAGVQVLSLRGPS